MELNDAHLTFAKKIPERKRTDFIILHHIAGHGSVEDVHREHLLRNFAGIGYNFYVRLDGSKWIGRGLMAVGAQCDAKHMNKRSLGIGAEGNFQFEEMPDVQREGIIEIIRYCRYLWPTIPCLRHSDVEPTDCPGKNYPFVKIATKSLPQLPVTAPVVLPQVEGYSRIGNRFYKDKFGKLWKPAGVLKLAKEKGLKIWRSS